MDIKIKKVLLQKNIKTFSKGYNEKNFRFRLGYKQHWVGFGK
jgi:hypothetical protein